HTHTHKHIHLKTTPVFDTKQSSSFKHPPQHVLTQTHAKRKNDPVLLLNACAFQYCHSKATSGRCPHLNWIYRPPPPPPGGFFFFLKWNTDAPCQHNGAC